MSIVFDFTRWYTFNHIGSSIFRMVFRIESYSFVTVYMKIVLEYSEIFLEDKYYIFHQQEMFDSFEYKFLGSRFKLNSVSSTLLLILSDFLA